MASTAGALKSCRALFAAAKSSSAAAAKPSAVSKKPVTKSAAKKPAKDPKPPTVPSGILRPYPVSPVLRNFLGVHETSRSDAVKKIWDYIKLHNLQNPTNKREIVCDEKLKTVFAGKDKIGILEVGKLLSTHFVKAG